MSITFSFKGDKVKTERFDCQCVDFDGPTDCHCCNGSGSISYERCVNSINWASVNARDLSVVLGFDLDSGVIVQSDFSRLLARCVRLLNTNDLSELVEAPTKGLACQLAGAQMKARFISFGRDLDSLKRRVVDFQALVVAAKGANEDIFFY